MKKLIISGLVILSAAMPVLAQEQAPVLDPGFGIKPFAMDDSWIIDVKQTTDGGFYVAGAWEGLTRLDAAGNKLWSAPYTATGNYVDMPGSIAVDDADNVYVGLYEYPAGKIIKYDPAGNQVNSYAVDDVLFGVVFNKELNRLYAVTGGGIILMLDSDLNFISSVSCGEPGEVMWAEGGIGMDMAGNIYVGGWVQSGTTKRLAGYKYSSSLVKLWEYSEPVGSSPFIAGETIPTGGMYLIREYRLSPTSLLYISTGGVKLWEKQIPEDYHYYKGVDEAGNFYGATWDENNDWAVTINKLGYLDGAVEWSLPELFSGEADDILWDGQGRLYTFGSLMEPVGADGMYVSRYGGDAEAPAAVSDLAVTAVSSNSITLSWTAPGDDGIIGTASAYDLCYATAGPLVSDTDFDNASQLQGEPVPQAVGGAETFTIAGLAPGTTYFFGIKTTDDAGNVSGLSNSPRGITSAVPAEKYSLSKSTTSDNQIVVVSSWSAPLVSLVKVFGTTNPASEIQVDFSISTFPVGATGFALSKSSESTNPQGHADVLLRLGNIPAEYGVTATCNTCEPSASTATFTCCGKLPNDHFSQSGVPAWSPTCYANNNCQLNPNATIGWRGCALTSLATLINYYNSNVYSGIPRTNPGDLNTYLRGLPVPDGYDNKNDVNFYAIERYTNNRVSFVDRYDVGISNSEEALLDTADGLIRSGIPLIFRVRGHFLLVVGKCGDKFIVSDPAGGQERLYDPDNPDEREFEGLRVFSVW